MGLAQLAEPQALADQETLTGAEWAKLLNVSKDTFKKRAIVAAGQELRNGGLTKVFAFASLPDEWRKQLSESRERHVAPSWKSLLEMRSVDTRWVPERPWLDYPATARERAMKRKEVMRVFFAALDNGRSKSEANTYARAEWVRQFGEECSEKSIRNWEKIIEARGGIEFAPDAAFLDEKSCAHKAQRVENKLAVRLNLSPERFDALVAEIKTRATAPGVEHMASVHRNLEIDWMMGREIPGLGVSNGSEPFPLTTDQVRAFMPSTAVRRKASHGEARYARECAPWIHSSTATIRPLELIVVDDTRIDIIATCDRTGRLIELKAYILMDVASRKILGWVIKDGPIGKEDVSALLARVLRAYGLPIGYTMHILFERGATACAPATETLLTSMWPGRIDVHRTSMDGGKSGVAGFWQSQSGHWMGKGWIESFMRTLAFYLQNIKGQRGGDYRRQPAMLGLKGRDHATGALVYDRGQTNGLSTQMHEAALTSYADLALNWIETGALSTAPRLKARALLPRRWVTDSIAEAIAYYNRQTDHRRKGFCAIEYQDAQGRLQTRMESSDERFYMLSKRHPAERIQPADAAALLYVRAKAVTVDARQGVTFDFAPFKGLRFWHPSSVACHQAGMLATQEKKMVAIFDPEAMRQWRPGSDSYLPEIHLIAGADPDAEWHPGAAGRYVETLPLYGEPDRMDEQAMAAAAADQAAVVRRHKVELSQAAGPRLARMLAELTEDRKTLEGTVAQIQLDRPQMGEGSRLVSDIKENRSAPTRAAQQAESAHYVHTLPFEQDTEL